MVIALPKVKIDGTVYYIDERLNELRNVKDPSDKEKMEGSKEFYLETFGEYKGNWSKRKSKPKSKLQFGLPIGVRWK